MGFLNPSAQQRARRANRIASVCAVLGTSTIEEAATRATSLLRAERERRFGVVVKVGAELRLYRRAEHAPPDARRIDTRDGLDAALARVGRGRVYGYQGTSARVDPAMLRALARGAIG